jgi:glycosyltransferase involved in cell wall biosynthesis
VIPHEKRPGDKMFTRYFLKPIDAFITLSEKVLIDLKKFAPAKKAVYIPHPLYDNFGEALPKLEARKWLGLPVNGKLILFFGFIRAYKGLDLLLRAMADQRIRNMDIHLLVAGEFYQDSKSYTELISALGLEEHVILRSQFIRDNEVRFYCSAADLIVQPYRHATQSGVTPLAYHFEKPMIVTNVGGLPAMVPDGTVGLIAEPDPQSIADHIVEFYELGEDHFLPHLREEKKKYAWSRLVKAILELANDIQK